VILQRYASQLQFLALLLLGVGLSTSVFLMSVGGILFSIAWISFPDLKTRIAKGIRSPYVILSAALFLLHLVGLLWTEDYKYAFNDIRIKIPLLLFPLFFASSPQPEPKKLKLLLALIVAATLISTLISFGIYLKWLPVSKDISDIRNISPFVSHIRLSLVVCASVVLLWWLRLKHRMIPAFTAVVITLWFIYFLYLIESATGIFILCSTALLFGSILAYQSSQRWIKIGIPVVLLAGLIFIFLSIQKSILELRRPKEDPQTFVLQSPDGCYYTHYRDNTMLENGYYTWSHLCLQELEQAWNERSKISFDGNDNKGQRIYGTIVRYLTSKGLHKDRKGVYALDNEDIHHIENGIANVNYVHKSGLKRRLEEIIFEIDSYFTNNYYTGNSLTQRFEFWSTGIGIFRENIWAGVGTGDAQLAFDRAYEKKESPLPKNNRLRSHNQFIAMAVAFGLPGIVLFILFAFYPFSRAIKENNIIFLLFYSGALISFFTEDTLETQAGITYFCFFTGLLSYFSETKKI